MNKYQEALKTFAKIPYANGNVVNFHKTLEEIQEDYKTLEELVDKEKPKKPIIIDEPDLHYIYYCPSCGATLMVDRDKHPKHLFNYCGKCSQKLDWN